MSLPQFATSPSTIRRHEHINGPAALVRHLLWPFWYNHRRGCLPQKPPTPTQEGRE